MSLAVLLLVAMALALSLLYANLQRDLAEAERLEEVMLYNLEVREALANLLEVHLDIQMGIGGHVFTGNPEFLGRYLKTLERIQPSLDRLRQLSAGGKALASDMPVLLSAVQDRVTTSRELAALMDAGRQADAQIMIASSQITEPMTRLRRLIVAVDAEALGRFEQAQASTSAVHVRIDRTLEAMLACLGVLLTVGTFVGYQLVRSKADQIEYTEALINAVIDPIFVLDEDGVLLLSNTAAESQFAYTGFQFHGANAGVILADPATEAQLFRTVRKLAETGSSGIVRDLLFRRRNGTCFQGNVSISIGRYTDELRIILVVRTHLGQGATAKVTESSLAKPAAKPSERSRAEGTV